MIRRRGYGEIGLSKEFQFNSIGVFMHRGDSSAEGGVVGLEGIAQEIDPGDTYLDNI